MWKSLHQTSQDLTKDTQLIISIHGNGDQQIFFFFWIQLGPPNQQENDYEISPFLILVFLLIHFLYLFSDQD